jgi:hypothetical protein
LHREELHELRNRLCFPGCRGYEFQLGDADLAGCDKRSAEDWLGREFVAAGCEPSNPMDKLIMADKVIQLARTIPAWDLAAPTHWVMDCLHSVACATGLPLVSIDLVESKVGY